MDKIWHFIAGVAISIVFGLYFNPVLGFCAGTAAGVAKELYDLYIKKTYINIKDVEFTVSGSCFGVIINLVIISI